jgi:hypothetical protein
MSKKRYFELLKKRRETQKKLARAKKYLGHPHGQWQSAHDLAESDCLLYEARLKEIEKEIGELKDKGL